MTNPAQLLSSPPSLTFTGVAKSQASADSSIGDFNSGSFNVGSNSTASLFMIAGGIYLLITLLKKGR